MNIFVAKLNPSTSEDSLKQLFEQFGEVSFTKVIMDRETGRSKCYGFVEMSSNDEGQSAVSALDQSDFEGNRIVVKEAEPRERRPQGGGGFQNKGRNFSSNGGGGGGYRKQGGGNYREGGNQGGGYRDHNEY